MRTVWKGYLKISMVSIPIKMYNATSSGNTIKFNLLHEKCNTRIRQQRVCPKCDTQLSNDEIVKGYQYGKDMYIVLDEEDFQKSEKEKSDFIKNYCGQGRGRRNKDRPQSRKGKSHQPHGSA